MKRFEEIQTSLAYYNNNYTYLHGIGDSFVVDKFDPCTVVAIPHAPPNDVEASLPRCGDEGTTIGSVLNRVDEQHCPVVGETEVVTPEEEEKEKSVKFGAPVL